MLGAVAFRTITIIWLSSTTAASTTKEDLLAQSAVLSLDQATANWAYPSFLCASYSGKIPVTPLDLAIVEYSPNTTGLTQQALWGLVNTLPSALNVGIGYADGKFILYRDDGFILAYRESGNSSCQESHSNDGADKDCRKIFSYGPFGAVSETATATLNTYPYDPRMRQWYKAAEEAEIATWSPMFMVSPIAPPPKIPGLSFAVPFYSSPGELEGVCDSELDSRQIMDILKPFGDAEMNNVVYVVETSTLYFAGSTVGEHSTYEENAISTVLNAKNPVIRTSAAALIEGSVFKADGSYSVSVFIDGSPVNYCLKLLSYSDVISRTMNWKLVVASRRDNCAISSQLSIEETSELLLNAVQTTFQSIATIPAILNFHSGCSIMQPLSESILELSPEPKMSGLSQQSTWIVASAVKNMSGALYSLGTSYVSEGTYLSYIFMDGRDSPGLVFRNIDSMASCDSFGNYGLIASDCTRLYNIYENGTANEVSAQYAYDARNEEFFRLATERGALQWSSPHFSNFSEEGLMTVSIPNYDPWTFEYRSVSFASVRLSHLNALLREYTASTSYTSYIADRQTGYLLATSTGEMAYSMGEYTFAASSSNELISSSYSYLLNNGINANSQIYLNNELIQIVKYTGEVSEFIDLDIVVVMSLDSSSSSSESGDESYFSDWEKESLVEAVFVLGSFLVAAVLALMIMALFIVRRSGMPLLTYPNDKAGDSSL